MRILITVDPEIPVPPTFYGGIERIVNNLAEELRARRHTVGLVANGASTCAVSELFAWPAGRSGGGVDIARNTAALGAAVRRFQPDIVHSFSRLAYLLPNMWKKVPKIMSYQRQTGGPQIRIAAQLSGRSLVFTACSAFIASMGRRFGGEWEVIPNFVDTDFFHFSAAVSEKAPLVFLSRIEEIKGVHLAIEIARQASQDLIIAGNRVEAGEGREYWTHRIAPHVDGASVRYVGPVDDVQKRDLLASAAALLVPVQWDEPFGIVFAEALSCGTPVISCPRGALPEIVKEGEVGFLVNSVEQGAAAVSKIGDISRSACRTRAESLFSAHAVVSQYEALYDKMILRGA